MKAACAGHLAIVEMLCAAGADLFVKDPTGKTALDWGRLAEHLQVAQQLERAVNYAIEHTRQLKFGSDELRELTAAGVELVEANIRVHVPDMLRAMEANDLAAICEVAQGVDTDAYVWAMAVRSLDQDPEAQECYLDVQNKSGWTPLCFAAANNDEGALKVRADTVTVWVAH